MVPYDKQMAAYKHMYHHLLTRKRYRDPAHKTTPQPAQFADAHLNVKFPVPVRRLNRFELTAFGSRPQRFYPRTS